MKFFLSVLCSPCNSHNQSLLQELAVLKKFQGEGHQFVYVTHNNGKRELKEIAVVAGFKPDAYISLSNFDNSILPVEKWADYCLAVNKYLEPHVVDGWVVYGGAMSESGGVVRTLQQKSQIPASIYNTADGMSFNYKRALYSKILTIFGYTKAFDIPIYHKLHDPAELSFGFEVRQVNEYHGYAYKHGDGGPDLQRFDGLQWYFRENNKVIDPLTNRADKELDFCFAALTRNKTRIWLADYVDQLKNSLDPLKSKIFYTDKYRGDSNYIDRSSYLDLVKKTRYTHIVLSCEHNHFSNYRFIESVANSCLPIIQRETNWGVLKEFGISEEILNRLILNDPSDIAKKISSIDENERLELLNYLQLKLCLIGDKPHLGNFLEL